MTPDELARIIDHTLLRAQATQDEVARLCEEAVEYNFGTVVVNPAWVAYCAKRLKDTNTAVAAVVGAGGVAAVVLRARRRRRPPARGGPSAPGA